MNDDRTDPADPAGVLRRCLVEQGIAVLAVVLDTSQAGQFVVYLHGLAGESQQRLAVDSLSALPPVTEVRVSERATSILLVRWRSDAPG